MSPNPQAAIPGFTCIAPTIWEHIPPSISKTDKLTSFPSLILLFTWTGASGRDIQSYTTNYQSLFPSSTILVIGTTIRDFCFRSSCEKQARLRPVIERIRSYGPIGRVLIHCFSEGGSNKAVEFAEAYRKVVGRRLQCDALALDSTSEVPRYKRPFSSMRKTRERLLDEAYWDLSAPRCYLYSMSDAYFGWEVQGQVQEATKKHVTVTATQTDFHCGLVSDYSTKYWDTIMKTWRLGLGLEYEDDEREMIKSKKSNCYDSVMEVDEDDGDSERTLSMQSFPMSVFSAPYPFPCHIPAESSHY